MISPIDNLLPAFLGRRMQVAFVVRDMQEALRYWTETMKVGPFVLFPSSTRDRKFIHRGQPSPVDIDLAFAYVGDVQIEIICQNNDAPSIYREFHASGREGMHHLAFWPDDFDASCRALERSGSEMVCSVLDSAGDIAVNYYTAPQHLGVMLELAPMTPDRVRYFGGIKALADHWDGTRPIRVFNSRAEFMASADCNPPA
jgi:catechol 2,3-dioxygenase-like lactoylglutathione lyase family enzyme